VLRERVAVDTAPAAAPRVADAQRDRIVGAVTLSIHTDLAPIEAEWRRFEQTADCTAFQTFDWLAAWQRHIGRRKGSIPLIVIGRFQDGEVAFLLPLAVEPARLTRRLSWLGQDQSDYNGPLLARDFLRRVAPEHFLATWRHLLERLQRDPRLRFDWIEFEKMPQTIGAQLNPFSHLPVSLHASGAYLAQLGQDWETFYWNKRSSATRRHDRAKRRRLAEFGEIRFVTCTDPDDSQRTIETLLEQKRRNFDRRGIGNIFARAGFREFLSDLAANLTAGPMLHVSRVEVGSTVAAANFGLILGDRYYHVFASYDDSALSHFGPGALHLRELLAYAIKRGLRWFDFTIGDEPYKFEWSDINLRLYDHSQAVTWRGAPANVFSILRRRIKRFVKQTPAVWRAVCYLRARIGAFSQSSRPTLGRPKNPALPRTGL
jgi:CelD/BcsL family acetyltransferase involved in cellulose biosynthesis